MTGCWGERETQREKRETERQRVVGRAVLCMFVWKPVVSPRVSQDLCVLAHVGGSDHQ